MISLQTGKPFDIHIPNVYRYMNKKYIDNFFEKGILRISSFRKFREYPDEIRGDKNEGGGGVLGTSDKSGFQFHVMTQTGNDAYMLSGSTIESENLMKTFGTDGYFRITKPIEFCVAISNSINGSNRLLQGICNYRDQRIIKKLITGLDIKDFIGPEGTIIIGGQKGNQRINEIIENGIDLMFLKEKSYQNQSEYRFIWTINTQFNKIEEFIDVECKEAVQYCERIE
jgi:hypothetical protein